jgi:hypothetical protein
MLVNIAHIGSIVKPMHHVTCRHRMCSLLHPKSLQKIWNIPAVSACFLQYLSSFSLIPAAAAKKRCPFPHQAASGQVAQIFTAFAAIYCACHLFYVSYRTIGNMLPIDAHLFAIRFCCVSDLEFAHLRGIDFGHNDLKS